MFGAGVLGLLLAAPAGAAEPGVRLSDLTWIEAEAVLTSERVVVLPLGAAAKEHGPHLLLRNDQVLADDFARRVVEVRPVALLAAEGIVLAFSDLKKVGSAAEKRVRQQKFGTHADEIETSMMLYIDPSVVRMEKAVADGAPDRPGPLTRDPKATTGLVSPSGVFGDPRLATRAKGEAVVEGFVADVLAEIDALARRPLPPGAPRSPLDAGR